MTDSALHKVHRDHLRRDAYLYVRQSTLRQVLENTESTQRQYALRERAVALGWPRERIEVIDSDLGRSGAASADREGFNRLITQVSLGRVGIVLGLEVSRLARNSADWHGLVELCSLTDTLILDEDGVYSPSDFNDRLLLGIKGTMSEAELHLIRARLNGGILAAARRGELCIALPTGLSYGPDSRVQLDPDSQVQASLCHFFATFERLGSASATVRHFRQEGLLFPRRVRTGPCRGETVWEPLGHRRALAILRNPRYAGAFVFGRHRRRRQPDGSMRSETLPQSEWAVLLPDAHPGYIGWDRFEANDKLLRANRTARDPDRSRTPPREGPALLQGLAICGVCGRGMTVRYRSAKGGPQPSYVCQQQGVETGSSPCQSIPGGALDRAIGERLVATVTPQALEAALEVQAELEARASEADALRRQRVERAQQEAEWAYRLFEDAARSNALARTELEARWNRKLGELRAAEEELERGRSAGTVELAEQQRQQIRDLAADFPRLWRSPATPQRERKRLARLLIADVTLVKAADGVSAGVRWRGGSTCELALPRSLPGGELRRTPPTVIAEIDTLLEHHTDSAIAAILNERGLVSGMGAQFHPRIIGKIRARYGLRTRYDRLRERGLLTLSEIAARLGVKPCTVRRWHRLGLLRGHAYNDKPTLLYEPPGLDAPQKKPGSRLSRRSPATELVTEGAVEVQYAA